MGSVIGHKDMPVLCFGSGLKNIGGDGPKGLFGQRQNSRSLGLSLFDSELSPGKGDMIEGDYADFFGSEPQAIGQMDHGVRPDIHRSYKLQA